MIFFAQLFNGYKAGKIVFYHDIHGIKQYEKTGTPISLFKSHFEIAKQHDFSFVKNIPLHEKEVMVCLDDGFKGLWDTKDFFYDLQVFPTVFLICEKIGKKGYLSEEEILELQRRGFVFQSHGVSHVSLTDCNSDDEIIYELRESKHRLESMLNTPITGFCFPRGKMSGKIYKFALAAGYKELYSSIPGSAKKTLLTRLYRRNLCQDATPEEFLWILRGGMGFLQNHYARKQFLGCMK